MNKIFNSIVLAAATVALSSCAVREMTSPELVGSRVSVTVNAALNGTKTVFGSPSEGVIPVSWSETGEALELIEVVGGAISQLDTADVYTLSNNGANASFKFDLAAGAAESYDYYALYPASVFRSNNKSLGQIFDFAFPITAQNPTASGPDPAFALMLSKSFAQTSQPAEMNMKFEHLSAYVKFNIQNVKLVKGEVIEQVMVQFPKDTLGGRFNYCEGGVTKYQSGVSSTAVINTTNIDTESGSFSVWMAARPFVFKPENAGQVSVVTNKRAFTKAIAAPSDIDFAAGTATELTVDMTTAEAPDLIVADLELSFDFATPQATLPTWPTAAASANGEYVYSVGGVDYSFFLYKTFAAASQLTVNAAGSYLGLPVVKDYKLVHVSVNSPKGGTKYICSITSAPAASPVVEGGEQQIWSAAGAHNYALKGTAADTRYYIYGVGPLPISKVTLYYDKQ